MNELEKYFNTNTGRMIHKWIHYFDIYEQHFSRFRGSDVCIVEFGISHGGSLQMWKSYFGDKCKIFGIDINPHCKKLKENQIEIIIGDQEDRNFLKVLTKKIPKIDILIDDGGHTMKQQINTFKAFYEHIDESGIYLCEDLHTSYWPNYGGGYKRRNTFIEYSKNFIDYINAWHRREKDGLRMTEFTRSVHSLHYYTSMLVIEKLLIKKPYSLQKGRSIVPDYKDPQKKFIDNFNNLFKKSSDQ